MLICEDEVDFTQLILPNPNIFLSCRSWTLHVSAHVRPDSSLSQAAKGMQRGPSPAEFEAAIAAQQAPPKNPPRKIADQLAQAHEKPFKWTPVERMAWEQNGRDVDVYVRANFNM